MALQALRRARRADRIPELRGVSMAVRAGQLYFADVQFVAERYRLRRPLRGLPKRSAGR